MKPKRCFQKLQISNMQCINICIYHLKVYINAEKIQLTIPSAILFLKGVSLETALFEVYKHPPSFFTSCLLILQYARKYFLHKENV